MHTLRPRGRDSFFLRRFAMDIPVQAEKGERLRKLHHGPRILVFPNAWDVASARMMEEAGYPAIATSSSGVAAALGYPDGQRISRKEMLEVVARIARAVSCPLIGDMRAWYGVSVQKIIETREAVVGSGSVGSEHEAGR